MDILARLISISTFLIVWDGVRRVRQDWREAFLEAAIVWATIAVLITDGLSPSRRLTYGSVLIGWSIVLLGAAGVWLARARRRKDLWAGLGRVELPRSEQAILAGSLLIVLATGVIAFVAPPNSYDAMTYHMARVMHWIQNQSVAYYPTNILRQLYISPGAEYLVLQFQILGGSDRLANSVEWFSMAGSAVGISLIARRLGADARGQLFSAAATVTLPMGILQASSTQTDYVTAFWLICFVYFAMTLAKRPLFGEALLCGASLGLAILTKGTSYLYALPFLMWLVAIMLYRYQAMGAALLAVVAGLTLSFNAETYVRNYELFSNPLGLSSAAQAAQGGIPDRIPNDEFSAAATLSNAVRNLALNLATPSGAINAALERGVAAMHGVLGISPDDPRTTWPGMRFEIVPTSFREAYDGNLLHVLFLGLSMCLILFGRRSRALVYYCIALASAYLLFCFYLKWQPWNSRLLLPLFVLASAVIGVAIARLHSRRLATFLMLLLIVAALPWVLLNRLRPLVGQGTIFSTPRNSLYFMERRGYEKPFENAAHYLAARSEGECRQIGLYTQADSWEYPFWVLLRQELGQDVSIEAVNVSNVSARTRSQVPEFQPCAILALDSDPGGQLSVGQATYSRARSFDFISVFLPGKGGPMGDGAAPP